MKKRFIKSLAALSSAVMLFGAVAQPVDYSFKFENNSSIMTADAATYPTGAYGGKISYQCADGAWIYFDYVDYNEEKALEVSGSYFTKEAYISIPATKSFQGKTYKVVGIKDNAFKGQKNLTGISEGANLKYIGNSAFENCTALYSAYGLSKSGEGKANLKSIGNNAFKNCSKIVDFRQFGDTEEIGDYAFYGCKSLKEICLSKECTSIGKYAFSECTSIETIDLSNSTLTTIPDYAFNFNRAATTIKLPETLKKIGNSAFLYCQRVKNIYIPKSVTSIDIAAFGYCTGLTTVIIPEATKTIGSSAFWCCNNLKTYVLKNSSVNIGTYALGFTLGNSGPKKESNITIWGNGGTAKTYASKNSFTYKNISNAVSESIENMKPHVWGITNDLHYYTITLDSDLEEYIDNDFTRLSKDGDCFGLSLLSILARNGYIKIEDITNNILSNLNRVKHSYHYKKERPLYNSSYRAMSFAKILQANQKVLDLLSYYSPIYNSEKVSNYTNYFLNNIECITYGDDVCMLTYEYTLPNGKLFPHAVVCFGLEYGDWNYNGKKFDARILIYDSNNDNINEESYILVNTKDGSWKLNDQCYNYKDNTGKQHSKGNGKIWIYSDDLTEHLNEDGISLLEDYDCTHPSIS